MVSIRAAKVEDLNEIRQLYKETIHTVNAQDYDKAQLDSWASGADDEAQWAAKIEEQHFLVAEIKHTIAGFASVTTEGYIDLVFVHKDFQGQGIATELMKAIESFAAIHHLSEIWSDVSITAKPFFIRRGFSVSKVYTKLFRDAAFENTIMVKEFP